MGRKFTIEAGKQAQTGQITAIVRVAVAAKDVT
jgi:hypothetical protein